MSSVQIFKIKLSLQTSRLFEPYPNVSNAGCYLLALSIAALLGLLCLLLGEADAEEPEDVSVCGLDISVGLNQGLPLLHHGPELVGGQAHAVEVGQTVLALNIFTDELELLERPLGILKHKINIIEQ